MLVAARRRLSLAAEVVPIQEMPRLGFGGWSCANVAVASSTRVTVAVRVYVYRSWFERTIMLGLWLAGGRERPLESPNFVRRGERAGRFELVFDSFPALRRCCCRFFARVLCPGGLRVVGFSSL